TPAEALFVGGKPTENGHFIVCTLKGDNEVRTWVSKTDLKVQVVPDARDLLVKVRDKTGNEVAGAVVRVGGKRLKYDASRQLYVGRYKGGERILTVQVGDEMAIAEVDESAVLKIRLRRRRQRSRSFRLYLWQTGQQFVRAAEKIGELFEQEDKGYVALSQPKYRVGDTLRVKAFLTNKHGRPLKREMHLRVSKGYLWGKTMMNMAVRPSSPGVYTFQTVLSDSLQLDTRYYVHVFRKPRGASSGPYARFRLEDYLNAESSFAIRAETGTFGPERTIVLQVEATDAVGLPLQDASAQLCLTTSSVEAFPPEVRHIPDTLWRKSLPLSGTAYQEIKISRAELPNATLRLKLQAQFRDANNETHTRETYFSIEHAEKSSHRLLLDKGRLQSPQQDENSGIFYRLYEDDTLEKTSVSLPLDVPTDAHSNRYLLQTTTQSFQYTGSKTDPVQLSAHHSDAHLHFQVENPHHIDLHWQIFSNRQQIKRGHSTDDSLQLRVPYREKPQTTLYTTYEWAGQHYARQYRYRPETGELELELEHPERVRPGDLHQFSVSVKDHRGQPVSGADVATAAVTARFQESSTPILQDISREKKAHDRHLRRQFSLSEPSLSIVHLADSARQTTFPPFSSDLLSILSPPNGRYNRYLRTPHGTTEFALFSIEKGQFQGASRIWVDNKLVYDASQNHALPYSLFITPGYHHLHFRTHKHEFHAENIYFPEGKKLEIFISVEHPPTAFKVRALRRHEIYERDNLALRQCLHILNHDSTSYGAVYQNGYLHILGQGGDWQATGVLQPGPVAYLPGPGREVIHLNFQPGMGFIFKDGDRLITEIPPKKESTSPNRRRFGQFAYSQAENQARRLQHHTFKSPYSPRSLKGTGFQNSLIVKFEGAPARTFQLWVHRERRQALVYSPSQRQSKGLWPGVWEIYLYGLDGEYYKTSGIFVEKTGTSVHHATEFEVAVPPKDLKS
ncbi:MAG: hypothetical protein AAF570_08965, partial [Bacteroidota bacterium]